MDDERRYDIDWLRVFAVYLLFLFHPAAVVAYPSYGAVRLSVGIGYVHQLHMPLFFHYPAYYHIKNAELSGGMTVFAGFIHQFHMPLFFVLAGWSIAASLSSRSAAAVVRERVLRLLVPFVFGCLIICPPIRFFEFKAARDLQMNFLEFLARFFGRIDWFTWSHLWFLVYLFVFSLIYLPLFVGLSRQRQRAMRISAGTIYLAIAPLALVQIAMGGRWPGYQNLYDDWANFSYYSLFFIYGFLAARHLELEAAVDREWRRAGLIGLLAAALMFSGIGTGSFSIDWIAGQSLSAIVGFCLIVALLGAAARFLAFSNGALHYLGESSLPVYILHHLPVVAIAYFVVQSHESIGAKYAMIVIGSLVATMAIYHFIIRPNRLLRFMFGMKPRLRESAVADGRAVASAS